MKILQIKPKDNLFLGGGKSFNKGENTWISTKLMPYPSVFYGAICSLLLSLNEDRRKSYIINKNRQYNKDETNDPPDSKSDPRKYLTIGNVYLYNAIDNHYYIPAPLDIFYKEDNIDIIHISKLIKVDNNIVTSTGMKYLFSTPKSSERCDGMFIGLNTFYSSYYEGQNDIDIISLKNITTNSYKVGIQRNKNYTARDEHLYRIDLTEFIEDDKNDWSYIVEYELNTLNGETWWEDGKDHLDRGYLKLGGEGKVCKYFFRNVDDYLSLEDDSNYDYMKLVLMSPLVIRDEYMALKDIEVIAASTGKSYSIGGFDLWFNKPKPMFNAFPEGSVFVLDIRKLKNKTIKKVEEHIKKQELFKSQNSGFGKFRIIPLKNKLILD